MRGRGFVLMKLKVRVARKNAGENRKVADDMEGHAV